MRGHEQIIAMRKAGKRPGIVFLNDQPSLPGELDWAQFGEHATVEVYGDTPEALDLRYLIGLTVSITGSSVERAKRFMEACKAAGAETVAAGYSECISGRFEGVWSEVWRQEVAEVL
jgi:hypothetical protein